MAHIERQVVEHLNICLYKHYVDDIFILTKDRVEAENIFKIMNGVNEYIKFKIEHPDSTNSIRLLDFCLTIDNDGDFNFCFYRKAAKKNTFPHARSALPMEIKKAAIHNELERISQRCSTATDKIRETSKFVGEVKSRGYGEIKEKPTRVRRQKRDPNDSDSCFFQFPFINDSSHHAIKRIFRSENLPVRIYSKNKTLRSLLNRRKTTESCNIRNCYVNNPKLCNVKMCVYELQCTQCSNSYIGSTIRQLHSRVKEHLQQESSSVFRPKKQCNGDFKISILSRDRIPNRLRFKEAVFIQQKNPQLNNKFEREELLHLIF